MAMRVVERLESVDIEEEQVVVTTFEDKVADAVEAIAAIPGITREQADLLVHAGFLNPEDILHAEVEDISEIEGLGEVGVAIMEAAKSEAARREQSPSPPEETNSTEAQSE